MTWTDDRVELLKTMWAEGKSASQIAKELGGITRNAVIGKVHRLGLSNRNGGAERPDEYEPSPEAVAEPDPPPLREPEAATAGPPPQAPARPVPPETAESVLARSKPPVVPVPSQPPLAPAGPSEISPEALANLAEIERKAKRLTLMQLSERTCKWPVGDPATDNFWFCGLPSVPGKPYCEAHVAVAFQPMSSRRDRRPGGR